MDLTSINSRISLATVTEKTLYLDLPICLKNQHLLRDMITDDITIRIYFKNDIMENDETADKAKIEV